MRLLDTLKKNIILEVSEKVKKQLLTRYKEVENVTDDEATIVSYLNDFERYKNDLPADKKDLTRKDFTYAQLKSLIDAKKQTKLTGDLFTDFKKKLERTEETHDDQTLKMALRKFSEIKSQLPEKYQDVMKFKYLDLLKLIEQTYEKLITKILLEKFKKEKPDLNQETILFYITTYLNIYDEVPFKTKGANLMTFDEFEHLVDGINAKTDKSDTIDKTLASEIPTAYQDDKLTIFAPRSKDECVTLRNGRTWCTSREGGHNMYYTYRLGHMRTLYYVIDEDKDFADVDYAIVVLVDPQGRWAVADGTNTGTWSGHQNIPFDDIFKRYPKLEKIKDVFKPKPLTDEEQELVRKYQSISLRPGQNPYDKFNSDKEVELWMEVNSPTLDDEQYEKLSKELRRKYISLGFDLTPNMLKVSDTETIKYYLRRKVERIKTKKLYDLNQEEIALLNNPLMKKVKDDLKSKFAKELVGQKSSGTLDIEFTGSNRGGDVTGKFIMLYGFETIFDTIDADSVDTIIINNSSSVQESFDLPSSIGKFVNIDSLFISNCVKTVPDTIGNLESLSILSLPDNKDLVDLPWDIINGMDRLGFLNLDNCPNLRFPDNFNEIWESGESTGQKGFYLRLNSDLSGLF